MPATPVGRIWPSASPSAHPGAQTVATSRWIGAGSDLLGVLWSGVRPAGLPPARPSSAATGGSAWVGRRRVPDVSSVVAGSARVDSVGVAGPRLASVGGIKPPPSSTSTESLVSRHCGGRVLQPNQTSSTCGEHNVLGTLQLLSLDNGRVRRDSSKHPVNLNDPMMTQSSLNDQT